MTIPSVVSIALMRHLLRGGIEYLPDEIVQTDESVSAVVKTAGAGPFRITIAPVKEDEDE